MEAFDKNTCQTSDLGTNSGLDWDLNGLMGILDRYIVIFVKEKEERDERDEREEGHNQGEDK